MFVSSFAILRHCSGISGLIGSPSSPLAHRRQLARRRPDDDSSPLLWQLLSGCRINAPALPPCMALPVPGPPQCLLAPTSGRHASRPFVALRTCTRAEVGCGGWQTVQQMQRMRARASHASSSSSMLVRAAATGKYKKKIQRTRGKGGGGHSEGGVYGNGGPTGEAEYYRCAEEERDLPFETIQAIARCIACGGVGVLPTDSSYAFVCDVSNVSALTKMYRLKRVSDPSKSMSVLCRHMADVNAYSTGFPTTQAVNWFRVCKKVLPGPYTFILHASKALPKQCLEFDKKCRIRRHVGVRVSNDEILNQVMPHLDRPLFCTTVPAVTGAGGPPDAASGLSSTTTGFGIYEAYKHGVDFVVDDGVRQDVSTVIDLTDVNNAVLVRLGSGSVAMFEEHLSSIAVAGAT